MKSVIGKVMKNTLWLLLQRVSGRFLTFILMIYLARSLGNLDFGKLTFANSFTLLFLTLSDLGITTITIREVARFKEKGPDFIGGCATLKMCLSIIAFIAMATSLAVVNMPSDTRMVAYLIGACILFRNMGVFFGAVFQAYEDMKYVTITEIAQQILLLSMCLLLIHLGRSLIWIGIAYLFCGVFYCFLNMSIVHWKFINPCYSIDTKFWLKTFKESIPLAIVAVISMVYFNIDIVMIGKIKGEVDAGWYGISYNIFFVIATLPGVYLSAVFPVISKFFVESETLLNEAYQRSFKIIIGVGIPLSIGLFLLAENIIFSLFGYQYHQSASILKIFSLLIILSYLNSLAGYFLTAVNKQKKTAKILAAITCVNVSFNLILIPHFSYIGAAYATVISELLLFIALTDSLPVKLFFFSLQDIAKPIVSSAIMSIFIIIMVHKNWNLPLTIIIAVTVYFLLIWISGYVKEIKKEELKAIS